MIIKNFRAWALDWSIVSLIALLAQLLYPTVATASSKHTLIENQAISEYFAQNRHELASVREREDTLPIVPEKPATQAKRVMRVEATAYTNLASLTDASPDITASGTRVGFGQIAANFLPFGAKIRIPDLYGNQEFVVTDRMHSRYTNRIDVFLQSYGEARQFGVKRGLVIEIL